MLKIGSHVSFSEKGLLSAAREAGGYGSSTFMIYTGAPQNTKRKPMESHFIEEGKQLMAELGIEEIVVHAPYIINLGSYKKETYQLAVEFLQSEIDRTAYIGVKNIVLHPGAYTDMDAEYGINRIAEGLNEVLKNTKDVNIALETMAGKGSEIGRSFEELAAIIERVEHNDRLTVCLDTCHVHDAGYDIVQDLDGVLEQFDRTVGLKRLAVLHLNDSKNPRGASKDRHAPIGAGYIGFKAMQALVQHEKLRHLPMVLETPWIGRDDAKARPMYETEIALLNGTLEQRFGAEFFEDTARLGRFFKQQDIEPRSYVLAVWDTLKGPEALATKGKAAKDKNKDKREPMERLYDIVEEAGLFPTHSEEQVNQRITAWFAGEGL
jgi:deoxyribonuclease-4